MKSVQHSSRSLNCEGSSSLLSVESGTTLFSSDGRASFSGSNSLSSLLSSGTLRGPLDAKRSARVSFSHVETLVEESSALLPSSASVASRRSSFRTITYLKEEARDVAQERKCHVDMKATIVHLESLLDGTKLPSLLSSQPNLPSLIAKLSSLIEVWKSDLLMGVSLQKRVLESKTQRQIRALAYGDSVCKGMKTLKDRVDHQKEAAERLEEQLAKSKRENHIMSTMLSRISVQYHALKAEYYRDLSNTHSDLASTFSFTAALGVGALQAESSLRTSAASKDAFPTGTVTLAFTDVESSTELWDQAEAVMRESLALHNDILRNLLVKHKGYEVKTEGDAFMVVFAVPLNALRWCVEVQLALVKAPWPQAILAYPSASRMEEECSQALLWNGLRVRMGLHIGIPRCEKDPVTRRMDYFGPMVNLSARISSKASGGQIVCSTEYLNTIRPHLKSFILGGGVKEMSLGTFQLKGIRKPVPITVLIPKQLQGRNCNSFLQHQQAEQNIENNALGSLRHISVVALQRIEQQRYKGNLARNILKVRCMTASCRVSVATVKPSVRHSLQYCCESCSDVIHYLYRYLNDMLEAYLRTRAELRSELAQRFKRYRCQCDPSRNPHKPDIPKTPVYIEPLQQTEFMRAYSVRRRQSSTSSSSSVGLSTSSTPRDSSRSTTPRISPRVLSSTPRLSPSASASQGQVQGQVRKLKPSQRRSGSFASSSPTVGPLALGVSPHLRQLSLNPLEMVPTSLTWTLATSEVLPQLAASSSRDDDGGKTTHPAETILSILTETPGTFLPRLPHKGLNP